MKPYKRVLSFSVLSCTPAYLANPNRCCLLKFIGHKINVKITNCDLAIAAMNIVIQPTL